MIDLWCPHIEHNQFRACHLEGSLVTGHSLGGLSCRCACVWGECVCVGGSVCVWGGSVHVCGGSVRVCVGGVCVLTLRDNC